MPHWFRDSLVGSCVLLALGGASAAAPFQPVGAAGWNIFSPYYTTWSPVQGFTFEWQYFMVHDEGGQYTGSIGYVVADPLGRLGKVAGGDWLTKVDNTLMPVSLMPSGPSVAVAGRWADGSKFADFDLLSSSGLDEHIGRASKDFAAELEGTGNFGKLVEVAPVSPRSGSMRLSGQTESFAWDLEVTPDWTFNNTDQYGAPFGPMASTEIGYLPGENWTVAMQWPRTLVHGTVTNRKTGQLIPVDGHGYRENSWGQYNFAIDGWIFSIVSDAATKVQWAWQTYHKSQAMDWLDVSFPDGGKTVRRRFLGKDKQVGWKLSRWAFHDGARQCAPGQIDVTAEDSEYRVHASYPLGDGSEQPMISAATPLTKIYVIMVHFPYIKGWIERIDTGEVVTTFAGQGGGEFSSIRSVRTGLSPEECSAWGKRFDQDLVPSPRAPEASRSRDPHRASQLFL